MSDLIDIAQDAADMILRASLSVRQPHLRAVGACFNCGEECHGCFCCAECGIDWEMRTKASKRNG